ncbi:eukaryotic translation initiation factor 4B2-like isoform X2 [Telopea speciosissima]|uniref:eukaryotic translation initiation factor 4B2-like isoform X2 n=1 Tax=Telopea speciosissima TaxID=54955 RepID=UPI001CC7D193|nr:eukaryotic translation initiation factor 4B2-like isoform X2 [Telopea speciosissima]
MSNVWGGIGAWAAEAERAEAEERENAAANSNSQLAGVGESQSFPSLREAASAKPKKKKMTLSEFTTGTYVGPGGARRDSSVESKGLTTDEMLRLPTGPKERTPEELEYGRLGGGFRSYGRTGPPPGRMRERGDDSDGSWGGGRRSYGGFDDERRPPSTRANDYDQPSRADEVDNWAMGKKPLSVSPMDSGRQDRYSSLGSGGGGPSRSDDVDNWAVGKKAPSPARSMGFGSGFRDPAPEMDRWSRAPPRDGDRERPRLVLDPPKVDGIMNEPPKATRPSPFGVARPREEILAEKGLDWKKLDSDIESRKTTSRPNSSQSSRPSSAQSNRAESPAPQVLEAAPKPRPKVNPFGDAKPREVLLEEKGKDWRKIDLELEHRRVDRPETDEEKTLKEEIDHLRKELEKESAVTANGETVESAQEQTSLHELMLSKEKDLELLIRELDDKVRFGQKSLERPGSGAGRFAALPERPPSQSGLSEDYRSVEYMERPRSHGTADVWSRPGDDRRAFQGGRERGFLGNNDRSNSRERW